MIASARAKVTEYLKSLSSGDDYSVAANFKGILSSAADINIVANNNAGGSGQAFNLSLEGVIICHGFLNIDGLNQVMIVYDPSQSVISATVPGATMEPVLEVVGFNRI